MPSLEQCFDGAEGLHSAIIRDRACLHQNLPANNCTSISYSLFDSSYNTVSNNTADYPFTMNFLLADGSSYNLVTGNVASTGDFIGYMVADALPGTWSLAKFGASHDNVFSNNISHSDGPTGREINAGIVPAFLGGFVVLNGTYNNTIQNNQDWSSQCTGFYVGAGRAERDEHRSCHISAAAALQRYNLRRRRRRRQSQRERLDR